MSEAENSEGISNQELIDRSELVEEYDYVNPEDNDDYVNMALYKYRDGRYFRYIIMSGYNSGYSAAGNIVEWIDANTLDDWKHS